MASRTTRRSEADCNPPGSGKTIPGDQAERACILCGEKMYFAEDMRVHVCLNKKHGAIAYYGPDDCYFTSRKDIAVRFAAEGRKFHVIEPEILRMIGVES